MNAKAWRFFHGNAGGIVGETALTAASLARAEAWANDEDNGIRFRWEWDESPDLSFMTEKERERDHEVLGCIMERRCSKCGQWEHVDSLWGIVDPDIAYRRIIEAELAANNRF